MIKNVMKKMNLVFFLMLLLSFLVHAQSNVHGIVLNGDSYQVLKNVSVKISNSNKAVLTNSKGLFLLKDVPIGRQYVVISCEGYKTQNYPINLLGKSIDIGTVMLYQNFVEDQDLETITITDDELSDENTIVTDHISGLFQSSKDSYLKTAAFEWSSSFYRIRGLDIDRGEVLMNGIVMNNLYNGRPNWSNWGGLNEIVRNQEFSNGLSPSNVTFGGVSGSTNMLTRASEFSEETKISYASSNRSYAHRLMATYTSGLMKSGWSIAFSASKRVGKTGYVEGTFYDANSVFVSLEKKFNNKHSLNMAIIACENNRGRSAPNTQEVFNLKGIRYNEYWGNQEGKARNSRVRSVYEPIFMLNYYLNFNAKTSLKANIAYQLGKVGNSRIDFNGGTNPSPTYYKKLPSFWIDEGNLTQAYQAEKEFISDGQLNWEKLYQANLNNASIGKNASYVLYEDRNDDTRLSLNTIFETELNEHVILNAKLAYRSLYSENFASVIDLLGGNGYMDINRFAPINSNARQNDLLKPNRVVASKNKFKYSYRLKSEVLSSFLQAQFNYGYFDFYMALKASKTNYRRTGFFQNGKFADNSLGKSKRLDFTNYSVKTGITYKMSGRHILDFNLGCISKAPFMKNTFSNPRENNAVVIGLESEKIVSTDFSYIFRSSICKAKLTGYFIKIKDVTNVNFYFLQTTANQSFVQEIVTGIQKNHIGAELGVEVKVTGTLKLKGATNFGQYLFSKNPELYITSEDFVNTSNPLGVNYFGKTHLKNYKVASGPQKAYSVGFDYRDPDYWWLGTTVNYFDDTFISISPIVRSQAFFKDADGFPFNNYDPEVARELLRQEKFESYMVVNLAGGKSWKIGNYYFGAFASVNNLLNKKFKTGGFEQSRRSDYVELLEESKRQKRFFGSKYWLGRGASYFLNIYLRF